MKFSIGVTACMLAGSLLAAEVPRPGRTDHRIRYTNYNPEQVYQITGFYGYHTTIFFDPTEKVEHTSAGYADGWEITQHGDYITVKPKERSPETSFLVKTDRRTYVFDLRARAPDGGKSAEAYAMDEGQIFLLKFRYPQDERLAREREQAQVDAIQLAAAHRAAEERRRALAMQAEPAKPQNRAYYYEGEAAIAPYEAWDDGTFTYLRFYAQSDLPSPFVLNDDGTESTANKHFRGDVMVIERTARRLILRKGQSVVCIYNENPRLQTPQPTSGASERGAERLLK